jgi:nucleotide-binding universal stress UspA family protein
MYRRILLGCDPEGLAAAAVPAVAALAGDPRTEVRVVAAEEMTGKPACRAVTEAWLDRLVGELRDRRVAVRGELRRARRHAVADELVAAARGWGADLVVLGTRQRGDVAGLLLGSVGHQVAARVDTPVLFVAAHRPGGQPAGEALLRRILLAVDGSGPAQAAVHAVAGMGGPDTEIRLVHVLGVGTLAARPPDPAAAERAGRVAIDRALGILEEAGRATTSEVRRDRRPVAEELARAAEEWGADVIVLGSRRLTAHAGLLLGSVAQDLVHRTTRPVLLAERPHAAAPREGAAPAR